MKIRTLILLLAALAGLARAESPPAPVGERTETLEPEVTIHEEKDRTVEEYRINGTLYMVKIIPRRGRPYYLMDLDGDGEMDTVEEDPARIVVPQWILFRW